MKAKLKENLDPLIYELNYNGGFILDSLKNRKNRAIEILKKLRENYPDADCTLDFREDPFRLLVSAILAAQCTDERVNKVTPSLFQRFPEILDFCGADQEEIEKYIKSCGLFRNKAKNIKAAAIYLMENHEGKVPASEEELLRIPGVGRKIANLILGDSFGINAVVVDTHCARLSFRFGLTESKNPALIEKNLMAVLPENCWSNWGHLMVTHGREICRARKAGCENCFLREICPKKGVVN